jgi:signal peptidase II
MALFAGLLGCDQTTKSAAQRKLRDQPPITLIRGALDLHYSENRGVAFNVERFLPAALHAPLFLVAAAGALVAIGWAWRRRRRETSWRSFLAPKASECRGSVQTIGYALIAAGTCGNLLDRLLRGYVIDFVYLHHWPIFNVADVSICIGVGCWVWASVIERRQAAR